MNRLTTEVRLVPVSFEGTTDVLNIWYRPGDVSPKKQRQVFANIREGEDRDRAIEAERKRAIEAGEDPPDVETRDDTTVQLLLSYLDRWDLLDDAGATVPINADTLSALGYHILNRINAAVVEDIKPDPTKRRNSAPLSAPAKAQSPNGSAPPPSPDTSTNPSNGSTETSFGFPVSP